MEYKKDDLVFYGYSQESVRKFLEELASYFQIKNVEAARRLPILKAQVRGTAKEKMRAAEAAGAAIQVAVAADLAVVALVAAGNAATPAQTEAAHLGTYRCYEEWLIEQYAGEEYQQELQEELIRIRQTSVESPRDFYTRILHAMQYAAIPAAAQQILAQTIFMNGIPEDIRQHVEQLGQAELADKINIAQGYWKYRHGPRRNLANEFPERLQYKLGLKVPHIDIEKVPATTTIPITKVPAITSKPVAQKDMDDLVDKMARMTAHLADLDRRMEQRKSRPTYITTENSGRLKCYLCDREGHMARECPTRSWKQGRPITDVNTIEEEYWTDDEYHEIEVYPAESSRSKRASKRTTPYPKEKHPLGKEPVTEALPTPKPKRYAPTEQEWEQAFQRATEATPQDEEMTETSKPRQRKIKNYEYDIWEDLSKTKANITYSQLWQVAPTLKVPVKQKITAMKPEVTFESINSADDLKQKSTSAYASCQVEDYACNAIIDTGAGSSIIAKHFLDRMGWEIDSPARSTLVIADGKKSVPLGEVRDVPVTFARATIPIRMIVTDARTYEIILGNDWLTKAGAVLNLRTERMQINWRGREFRIPLNLRKGILPGIVDDENDKEDLEDDLENDLEDEKPYILTVEEKPVQLQETIEVTAFPSESSEESEDDIPELLTDEDTDEEVEEPIQLSETIEAIANSPEHSEESEDDMPKLSMDEDTDEEEETSNNFRSLNRQEQNEVQEWMIQNRHCPFCGVMVHCAEQICDCPLITRIAENTSWEDNIRYPIKKRRELISKKNGKHPEYNNEPWSAQNPHPFADSNPNHSWDYFWEQAPYVGKNRFYLDRWRYTRGVDNGCYWDEVHPEDYWYVNGRNPRNEDGIDWKKPMSWEPIDNLPTGGTLYQFEEKTQQSLIVEVKRMVEEASLPTQATEGSAGWDLRSSVNRTLPPRETVVISTGLKMMIPTGYYGQIQSRSSFAASGITVEGGVIDSDYRGEIMVILRNHNIAPYRHPPAYEKWVKEEIQQLLNAGIIRKSTSPWASPIILVPKKDGVPRMCVDYRKLNAVTRKHAYPLPRIDDAIDELGKATWYSSLDLWSGYHQIGMTPEARERSAFVTKYGQYEYNRMSFGLCNAPATFQAAMNELFGNMLGKGVLVYLDDIIVYAEIFEEHGRPPEEVLQRTRGARMRIKAKKCHTAGIRVIVITGKFYGVR